MKQIFFSVMSRYREMNQSKKNGRFHFQNESFDSRDRPDGHEISVRCSCDTGHTLATDNVTCMKIKKMTTETQKIIQKPNCQSNLITWQMPSVFLSIVYALCELNYLYWTTT